MSEELGPIVIDPHAFRRLVPALGIWAFLFLTAGDGCHVLKRQLALRAGEPGVARIEGTRVARVNLIVGRERRHFVDFSYPSGAGVRRGTGAVSRAGAPKAAAGARVGIRVHRGAAYLEDDLGYSRWKLGLFGAAFAGLWLWAAATYRFG
ncbi:MAG: hypothetical protein HY553_22120 [Elusimicrobia bacterium]|nr:hypothetical protein [Elusimicrobiota bacterium]